MYNTPIVSHRKSLILGFLVPQSLSHEPPHKRKVLLSDINMAPLAAASWNKKVLPLDYSAEIAAPRASSEIWVRQQIWQRKSEGKTFSGYCSKLLLLYGFSHREKVFPSLFNVAASCIEIWESFPLWEGPCGSKGGSKNPSARLFYPHTWAPSLSGKASCTSPSPSMPFLWEEKRSGQLKNCLMTPPWDHQCFIILCSGMRHFFPSSSSTPWYRLRFQTSYMDGPYHKTIS